MKTPVSADHEVRTTRHRPVWHVEQKPDRTGFLHNRVTGQCRRCGGSINNPVLHDLEP